MPESINEQTLRDMARLLEETFQLLLHAEVNQWTKPVRPSPQTYTLDELGELVADPGIRQKGLHSDPTGDIVVNDERMQLRHTLGRTERELDQLLRNLGGVRNRLLSAQRPWGVGEEDE